MKKIVLGLGIMTLLTSCSIVAGTIGAAGSVVGGTIKATGKVVGAVLDNGDKNNKKVEKEVENKK